MRFTFQLGFSYHMDYQKVAQAAENAGFNAIGLPDSFFHTKASDSEYPYADTQSTRSYIENMAFIDPLVSMTWMAAVTSKIKFYPSVLKVPTRQPLVLAKGLTSLAALTGGRILLGAGLSPWKDDYIYNGVDFDKRGKLMDDCIAIIRGAMSGESFEFHSEHYDFGPMKMNPVPAAPVPIIVGGHAKPALSRAARLGDGWVSANTDFETLKTLITDLNTLRDQHGTRSNAAYQIHGFDVAAKTVADFKRMAEIGVTDACVLPWDMMTPLNTAQQIDAIKRFGDEVIARY